MEGFGGIITVIIIIATIVSGISKQKKQREQMERKKQEAARQFKPSTAQPTTPSRTTSYWPPEQPTATSEQKPGDIIGEVLGEIQKQLRQGPATFSPPPIQRPVLVQRPQAVAQKSAARPNEDFEGQQSEWNRDTKDSEGSSAWNRDMQSGSMGKATGIGEGDCDDISHYHSSLEVRVSQFATASGFGAADKPATVQKTTAPSGSSGSLLKLQKDDVRRAVIWSEVLKRPQFGVSPRMR